MRRGGFIVLCLGALMLLCFTACRRTLWVDYGLVAAVVLEPDWSEAGQEPGGCETFIYDGNGALAGRILSSDVERVTAVLSPGEYQAVTVSYSEGEYGSVVFSDEDRLDSFRIEAIEGYESWMTRTKAEFTKPEWIATGVSTRFIVSKEDCSGSLVSYRDWKRSGTDAAHVPDTVLRVPVPMRNAVTQLRIRIHATRAETVTGLVARVQGLSRGWAPATQTGTSNTCAVGVTSWTRQVEDDGRGVFSSDSFTFGAPGGTEQDLGVTLTFLLGESYYEYVVDADQISVITTSEDESGLTRMCINIDIASEDHPIELPDIASGGGAGLDAWLSPWGADEVTTIAF